MIESQLINRLMEELVHAWLLHYSPAEIGSDVVKIEILEACKPFLQGQQRISPEVLDLYEKVYLRDVWEATDTT